MGPKTSWALLLCGVATIAAFRAAGQQASTGDFGSSLANLTPAQQLAFDDGKVQFAKTDDVADGLGPVFNDRSCGACHRSAAMGGGGNQTVTRFGRIEDGTFDPLVELGGSLIQSRGIGAITTREGSTNFQGEAVPQAANVVARRRTTPLFGLGLVDAVPDETWMAIAGAEASDPDGATGRLNVVLNLETRRPAVGKFGWKAQVPTLLQFSADAYLNEMGITSPLFRDENCPQGNCALLGFNPAPALNDNGSKVQKVTDFMVLLGPPPRGPITADVQAGEGVFAEIGCATCHLPAIRTGPSPIAALNRVSFHPYSDFLLHDMGGLGDGIPQGLASGRDMRTAPLWGLRTLQRFLHDRSARSLEQAIERHDGQGLRSRDRFSALDADRLGTLLAFLRSL
jgi:CxxC motif-containing protein (DUF1111 family)